MAPELSSGVRKALSDLTAFASSALVCNALILLHGRNPVHIIEVTLQIIERRPPWIAFQNRLAAPSAVRLLLEFGVDAFTAFWIVIFVGLAAFAIIYQRMIVAMTGSYSIAAACLAFSMVLVIALHDVWLYTWDFPDMLFFALLAFGVLNSWKWQPFILLFAFGIISRETALFVALYFIIDSFDFPRSSRRFKFTRPHYAAIGFALLLIGGAYIKITRTALFISKPDGSSDAANSMLGNHVYWWTNVRDLLVDNWSQQEILCSVLVLSLLLYCFYVMWRGDDRQAKVAIIAISMVFNILIFGLLNESRMLLPLIPVAALLVVDMAKGQRRSSPSRAAAALRVDQQR